MDVVKMVARLLDSRERRQALVLLIMICGMSVFEVLGVAAVLPFLNILIDVDRIETTPVLSQLYEILGFSEKENFIIFLAACLFLLIGISMLVRGVATYFMTKFSMYRAYSISSKILDRHLAADYRDTVGKNASNMSRKVLSEVDTVVAGVVLPLFLLLANALVAILIITLIIVVSPTVALGTIFLMGIPYLLTFFLLQGRIRISGKQRVAANSGRFHTVDEITTMYKEIKISRLERHYSHRFRKYSQELARSLTVGLVLGRLPRFVLEGGLYGGFILYALVLFLYSDGDLQSALPVLGLIGMAATKLFPAMQQIFAQASLVRMNEVILRAIVEDIKAPTPRELPAPHPIEHSRRVHKLELRDVRFAYPESGRATISGISLTIPRPSKIGIVGGTGSGKTTLLDILAGLLQPDRGEVLVDGHILDDALRPRLMSSIGYVGQSVSLIDGTIAENVALGAETDRIDPDAVKRALAAAHLDDVVSSLDAGMNAQVGRNGIRLSGGQRQRLGIARALYRNPDILILDEATSALDNLVEAAFMESLQDIAADRIVIMVAHRLSTVRNCDVIYFLQQGRILASGSYDQLMETCTEFRLLAEARPS